jgi:hypothetical protein
MTITFVLPSFSTFAWAFLWVGVGALAVLGVLVLLMANSRYWR